LAAAMAIIGQEQRKQGRPLAFEHVLLDQALIEEIISRAAVFERLIAKSGKFPVKADILIHVRPV
jgi:hypothetical protein